MNKEKVSILGILVNFFLGGSKFLVGLMINSAALMSEGIHSGLDLISSFVTFLGIKVAKKPVDEKHPYGHYIAETIGGFVVVILLAGAGIWIIYEGISRIFTKEIVEFSLIGILIISISIILNEVMARLKFKYGRKEESLALVADAEHSRADVVSSIGVLIALIAVKYFWVADGIITFLIGLYILKESYEIGRETTDNLLGVKDEKAEKRIKEICQERNIAISNLKTRKIGAATFAEITIKLDPQLRVEEAETISKSLQDELINKVKNLKYAVIQIESHEIKTGFIKPRWGRRFRFRGRFQPPRLIGPSKRGYRIIIPIKDNEIYDDFGASEYLIVDKENGKILQKEIIKNPYFSPEAGRGMRIVKETNADEIITKRIGPGAKERAEELGIKVTIVPLDKKLAEIL